MAEPSKPLPSERTLPLFPTNDAAPPGPAANDEGAGEEGQREERPRMVQQALPLFAFGCPPPSTQRTVRRPRHYSRQ